MSSPTSLIFDHQDTPEEYEKIVVAVIEAVPWITDLSLGDVGLGDDGVNVLFGILASSTTLLTLNLYFNQITPIGFRKIADQLSCPLDDLGEPFGEPPKPPLRALSMAWNDLSDAAVRDILRLIKSNHYLRELSLAHTLLTNTAAVQIRDVCKQGYSCLTSLNLKGNEVNHEIIAQIDYALKKPT